MKNKYSRDLDFLDEIGCGGGGFYYENVKFLGFQRVFANYFSVNLINYSGRFLSCFKTGFSTSRVTHVEHFLKNQRIYKF